MKETIPRHSLINTLDQSWDIAKILETCYFRYFGNDWPCPPELTVSTCTKAWCLYACKTSALSIHPFFLEILQRYCKLIYFGWFGYAWLWSSKRMVSACKNLHAKNQIAPSRLSWNTANILRTCFFGYFGHTWPHSPKNRKSWFCMQKINFTPSYFFEILQRYCNLVILGTLGMPD